MTHISTYFESVMLSKAEFSICTGLTPYALRKVIHENRERLEKIGYRQYDKTLMPVVVSELLKITGLRLNDDELARILRGQYRVLERTL